MKQEETTTLYEKIFNPNPKIKHLDMFGIDNTQKKAARLTKSQQLILVGYGGESKK